MFAIKSTNFRTLPGKAIIEYYNYYRTPRLTFRLPEFSSILFFINNVSFKFFKY